MTEPNKAEYANFSHNEYVKTDMFHELAVKLHTLLGCKDQLTVQFLENALQAVKLFDYKQSSYGPGNIAAFGAEGVLIRSSDKLQRLINFWRKKSEPTIESIDSTWMDLSVYCLIAIMCRQNQWPNVKGVQSSEKN